MSGNIGRVLWRRWVLRCWCAELAAGLNNVARSVSEKKKGGESSSIRPGYNIAVEQEQHSWIPSETIVRNVAHANSEMMATVRHLVETFGSTAMADEWLNDFCPALGVPPVELMDDDQGRLAINRVLICISHGMIY